MLQHDTTYARAKEDGRKEGYDVINGLGHGVRCIFPVACKKHENSDW